jgi:hypothetical protein
MPAVSEHVVRQGEHLASIAEQYGFADSRTIWDHPRNAELRGKRDPDVLLPGDTLFVPERRTRNESAATETRHRFVLHAERLLLRLVVQQPDRGAAREIPVVLSVEGRSAEDRTSGEGLIERRIPRSAAAGSLVFTAAEPPFDARQPLALEIGGLDPIDTRSGQEERLRNLGYYGGPPGGPEPPAEAPPDSEEFRSAVEEFQCDHGLGIDGVLGPKTQAALLKAHGS